MSTTKTAADIMAKKLITLSPNMDLAEAMEVFLTNRISGAPVVDGGRLVGILSEKDCMKILVDRMYFTVPGAKVADFMTQEVKSISPDTNVLQIAELFLGSHFRRLPVVDGDSLVGQVSRRDVLRAVHEMMREAKGVSRSSEPLEQQTRQGRMARDADELRDVVGPETNKRFSK